PSWPGCTAGPRRPTRRSWPGSPGSCSRPRCGPSRAAVSSRRARSGCLPAPPSSPSGTPAASCASATGGRPAAAPPTSPPRSAAAGPRTPPPPPRGARTSRWRCPVSHDRPGGRRLPAAPLLIGLVAATAVSAVVSLSLGSEPLRVSGVVDVLQARLLGSGRADPTYDTIVWELRAPRVVMAVVVGAGLAMAGACMQTLVRNPLADPYLLGVSAGAGVGATAVIVLGLLGGLGVWALSLGALGGALLATALVFGISMAQGGLDPLRLILTGVVMSAAFSSVSSFLVFFSADPKATQSVLFWLLGSLSGSVWAQTLPSVIVVCLSVVLLMGLHSWLDALASGADVAAGLGVPVRALRTGLFVLVSVLVGVLVAVSGGIGFVGLV